MRSLAELRRPAEWALRVLLVVALAVALWHSLRAAATSAESLNVSAGELTSALRRATRDASVSAIDLDVDSAVPAVGRDWLVALRRAGVAVRWRGAPPALALSAERAREPVAATRFRLATADDVPVVLADSVGAIDTLRPSGGGAAIEASDVVGGVSARRGRFAARVETPAPAARRAVLVLGRAGWESRFVLAALGEAGWTVRARLPAAPGVAVTDAGLLPLDTSRYDVVVALDSTAADLALAIARFVSQGGGLLAAGSALSLPALRDALPARASARRPGAILLDGDTLTPAGLPLRPLVGLRADAVPLERQAAGLASAIRRAGSGRVAAVGYDESWRWRMQGGESGEAAHRAWWSRMVGLVAPERDDVAAAGPVIADAAPRAALVAALGPPSRAALGATAPSSARLPLALLLLALAGLLAETASRRFRGEP